MNNKVDYVLAKDCSRCKECCLDPNSRACWDYSDEEPRFGVFLRTIEKEANIY